MRGAFVDTLVQLAGQDARILLLTGDLGYMVVEPFAERFPGRFYNVGVAEQNMIGLATGLAEAGFFPFVYSIAPFASLRAYEFIRNGPVLHRLPVRIAGVGGGFDYGTNGFTHYGLDDVGTLRVQPDLTVVAPADHAQARAAVLATWDLPGPVYYRLGKDERTTVAGLAGRFALGRLETIRDGADLLLVAMGSVALEAVAAAVELESLGISCGVDVIASVTPPPVSDLVERLGRFRLVVTVEAHYATGGIGSLVSEVAAGAGLGCRVVRRGVDRTPVGVSGSTGHLLRLHGLDRKSLVALARSELASGGRS